MLACAPPPAAEPFYDTSRTADGTGDDGALLAAEAASEEAAEGLLSGLLAALLRRTGGAHGRSGSGGYRYAAASLDPREVQVLSTAGADDVSTAARGSEEDGSEAALTAALGGRRAGSGSGVDSAPGWMAAVHGGADGAGDPQLSLLRADGGGVNWPLAALLGLLGGLCVVIAVLMRTWVELQGAVCGGEQGGSSGGGAAAGAGGSSGGNGGGSGGHLMLQVMVERGGRLVRGVMMVPRGEEAVWRGLAAACCEEGGADRKGEKQQEEGGKGETLVVAADFAGKL